MGIESAPLVDWEGTTFAHVQLSIQPRQKIERDGCRCVELGYAESAERPDTTPERARKCDYQRRDASIPSNATGIFEVTPSIIIQP